MGLTIEKSLEITLQKAKELFPNEKWIQDDSLIFHAENRKPKNKQQKLVFEKENKMAKVAQENGHAVCLLPETNLSKNPDGIMDGLIFEFKDVTGNLDTMAKRFHEARKQSENVYIFLESHYPFKSVYKKLKGEVNDSHYKRGKIYLALLGTFYTIDISDLK